MNPEEYVAELLDTHWCLCLLSTQYGSGILQIFMLHVKKGVFFYAIAHYFSFLHRSHLYKPIQNYVKL